MPSNSRSFTRRVLFLITVLLLAGSAWTQTPGPGERFQRTFPLKSGGLLEVHNDRGGTSLDGWDKNEVQVEVVKRFEGGTTEQRERWLRETTVDFEASADRVAVKVHLPNNFCIGYCDYRARVDLTIHAPRQLSVNLNNDRGPVRVADINGDVRLRIDRGVVNVERVTGGLSIHADRTPVHVRELRANQAVDLAVERADLELDNVVLAQGGRLSAGRGSIRARLPENVALTLDVGHDRRSSFHSDFPVTTTGSFGVGALHGSINGGGPVLRLRAERGAIRLERGPRASGM